MIEGVQKLVVEVEDQDRARRFWTEAMGFTLVQDSPYGDERWLEVRTPDRNTIIVLALRLGEPPLGPEELPTSNIFFYCDDLPRTYEELEARGSSSRRRRSSRSSAGGRCSRTTRGTDSLSSLARRDGQKSR